MTDITKPDGSDFDSPVEQRDYIKTFYGNLYKLPDNEPACADEAIEDFLGPDLINHPIVNNSKLTVCEPLNLRLRSR